MSSNAGFPSDSHREPEGRASVPPPACEIAPSAAEHTFDFAAEFRRAEQGVAAYRDALGRSDVPALAEALTRAMRAERLDYGPHRMLCNTLRPHFITVGLYEHVRAVVTTLVRAMHRVARCALDDVEMLDAFGVTSEEQALMRVDPGYPALTVLSRLDTFVSPEGLHLVEYNAECPTGAGYNQRLFRVFNAFAPLREFVAHHPVSWQDGSDDTLESILSCWRAWGGEGSPRVGIVDWQEVVTRGEFEIFAEWFRAHDVPTVLVDPRALTIREGRLYGADERIDVVYRRLLTTEFLERRAECAVLDEAYQRQAACFVNSFRTKALHKKLIFSIFHDPRFLGMLTDEERTLGARHVPWTARVQDGPLLVDGETHDLMTYVVRNQADLVLKPNDDYGGKGLVLGSQVDPATWRRKVEEASMGTHVSVLQRRIPLFQTAFPDFGGNWCDYYVDLDPFFYGDRMYGFMSRMSTQRISNVSTGGGQMPTYVLT